MKNIYELFEEFQKKPTKEEKINYLRSNGTWALKNVLKGTFDPNVQFVFDKPVDYKDTLSPPGLSYSSIHQELGRIYIFEKNSPKTDPNLKFERKKQILIQILEALEKREAEVFMNMLLKKQDVKGLTYDLVKEAFPDLLP